MVHNCTTCYRQICSRCVSSSEFSLSVHKKFICLFCEPICNIVRCIENSHTRCYSCKRALCKNHARNDGDYCALKLSYDCAKYTKNKDIEK